MSDFEVALPDGRSIVVAAPDAQSAAKAARLYVSRESGKTDAKGSYGDGVAQAFGSSAVMNSGDELAAGVRAALPEFSNWMMRAPFDGNLTAGPVTNIFTTPDDPQRGVRGLQGGETLYTPPSPAPAQTVSTAPTMEGRYDEELARERAKAKGFQESNPVLATGANIAGNVAGTAAMSVLPGVRAMMSGGGLVGQTIKGAATGGALGGLAGYGEGEGQDDRIAKALLGGGVGLGIGAVAPAVVAGGRAAYEYVAPSIFKKAGDVVEYLAPRADRSKMTLSAAAPDGGPGVPMDSRMLSLADTLTGKSADIINNAAARRVANSIRQEGLTPAQARAKLDEFGADAFISDLGRNLQRPARDAFVLPGEGQRIVDAAFDARNVGAPSRMVSAFEGKTKPPSIREATDFLEAYQSSTGSKLYDPVLRGAKPNISTEMRDLAEVPAIKEVLKQIEEEAIYNGVKLTVGEQLHLVKRTLNKNTDAAFAGGKAINKDMVRDIGERWEKALWKANPEIQAADQAYAKVAVLPERLKEGQQFLKTGTSDVAADFSPSALSARIPEMTQQERAVLGAGAVNTARDTAAKGPDATRALAKLLTQSDPNIGVSARLPLILPEQAPSIMSNARAEGVYAKTDRGVRGGASDRAGDIQAAFSDFGSVPTDARGLGVRVLDLIKKGVSAVREPNEATRAQIARLLTNSDQKINAETLALIETILKQQQAPRVLATGAATTAGSAAGSM